MICFVDLLLMMMRVMFKKWEKVNFCRILMLQRCRRYSVPLPLALLQAVHVKRPTSLATMLKRQRRCELPSSSLNVLEHVVIEATA